MFNLSIYLVCISPLHIYKNQYISVNQEMYITNYLAIGLLGLVSFANGVITDDPMCKCHTTECCNIDDSTSTVFTGLTGVQLTFPNTSFTGKYTVINQLQYNETSASDYNTTQDYQYVIKYENSFKTAFDRNLYFYTGPSQNISCTESHVYVGDPESDYSTRIDLVEQTDGMGNTYCTMDVNGKLTDEQLAVDNEVYFAFNRLVNEKSSFNIGYDMTNEGVIVPISDIIIYPYVIKQDSVSGEDTFGGGEFYIDLQLNVSDINDSNEEIDPSCMTPDELMLEEAYWLVPGGTNCPVTVIQNGTGDLEGSTGRNYHLQIKQTEYESCSVSTRESGGNIHFDFRLVLPTDHTETVEADSETCYYFAQNLNVQNITISVAQDVTETMTAEYVTDFQARVTSLIPDSCTDTELYPTPHAKLKIKINATFPGVNELDFTTIGIPTFGETWQSNALKWDDGTAAGTNPEYTCTAIPNGAGSEDDQTICEFRFISSVCEPMYETADGACAFERNTTRFVTDFTIEQTLVGGQTATYVSGPLNSGIDNTDFDLSYCEAQGERDVVNVNDLFEVTSYLRNYYLGESVDWDNTTLLTMKDDMIARLEVSLSENTPTEFADLSIIIKTVNVALTNPITDEQITSYSFNVADKKDFMGFSWTPYYTDPRFCAYYDSSKSTDKCEAFFVNDTRYNTNHHTNDWIGSVEPKECQRTDTLVGKEDTKNTDHFLFTPREWFRDNINGYVKMTVTVSATVHQCLDSGRRLQAIDDGKRIVSMRGDNKRVLQSTPDVERDVLYISDQIIVTFVTDGDDSHVEVTKPTPKTFWEENQTLIIVGSVIAGIIILGLLFLWIQKRNGYSGIPDGVPFVVSASRPDF